VAVTKNQFPICYHDDFSKTYFPLEHDAMCGQHFSHFSLQIGWGTQPMLFVEPFSDELGSTRQARGCFFRERAFDATFRDFAVFTAVMELDDACSPTNV
jgi:hypothetical protein